MFEEERGYPPPALELEVTTDRLRTPRIALSRVRFLDSQTGTQMGNGDGTVQGGEQIEMIVSARNSGEAALRAGKVRVTTKTKGVDGVHRVSRQSRNGEHCTTATATKGSAWWSSRRETRSH